MYCLNKLCYICLINKSDLKHMFDVDNDGVSHYNKLTSSIAEMHFKEMNDQRLICGECCVTLNTVYNFRQMCLRSKTSLIIYLSQLQTSSHVSGTLSVRLKDIKQVKKPECEIKVEDVEETLNEYNQENTHSVLIKEECDSEEEIVSSVHEDVASDHMDEDANSDVKIEDIGEHVEKSTAESIHVPCNIKGDIDIEDHMLVLKKEPMSDAETPQDGSTSQENVDLEIHEPNSHPKINESEKILSVERPYKCDLCERSYMTPSGLKMHKLKHCEVWRYECNICHKKFIQKNLLKHHQRTYPFDKKFECKKCGITFPFKTCFNNHMRTHSKDTRERPFECGICKKRFVYKSNLSEHMTVHSDDKPYECEICKKKFSRKSHQNRHMGIHAAVRPFQCKLCNKSFSYKSYYTEHMQIHNTIDPYKCELCQKKFRRKSALTRHRELHAETFECELCSASFTIKKYFTIHVRTHTEGRPFKCEVCQNAFMLKGHLTSHMRIHTGERPFQCQVCLKAFTFKSNLRNHMQLHSNEKPFECDRCDGAFFTQNHLRVHIQRNHLTINMPQNGSKQQ